MESLSRATRNKIASAAHYRCEYCQTAQEISGAQMHIEHVIPLSRGGRSDKSNLCLACAWCNSYNPTTSLQCADQICICRIKAFRSQTTKGSCFLRTRK